MEETWNLIDVIQASVRGGPLLLSSHLRAVNVLPLRWITAAACPAACAGAGPPGNLSLGHYAMTQLSSSSHLLLSLLLTWTDMHTCHLCNPRPSFHILLPLFCTNHSRHGTPYISPPLAAAHHARLWRTHTFAVAPPPVWRIALIAAAKRHVRALAGCCYLTPPHPGTPATTALAAAHAFICCLPAGMDHPTAPLPDT